MQVRTRLPQQDGSNSYAQEALEAEARQSGAKFLLKPIDSNVLLALLTELLGDPG